jgi:hypothetical protein
MRYLRFIIIICLSGCLAKPDQSTLTKNEVQFIDSLKKDCNCKVRREVDVMLLGQVAKEHKQGVYALVYTLECEKLKWYDEHRDKAKNKMDQLIMPLYRTLNYDSKFDEILIYFDCETTIDKSSNYQTIAYTYKTDSLIGKTNVR